MTTRPRRATCGGARPWRGGHRSSSRKRSSSKPAISVGCHGDEARRGQLIASGMPSSRRQISPTAAAFDASTANPGRADSAHSKNSRPASLASTAAGDRSGIGHRQATAAATPARRRSRAPRGWSRPHGHAHTPATSPRPAGPRRPAGARSCRARRAHCFDRSNSTIASSQRQPRARRHRQRRRDHLHHRPRVTHGRELEQPRSVGEALQQFGGELHRDTRLPDTPGPRDA